MKTLARTTAVILIIVGIIIMLSGVTMGVIGLVRAGSRALDGTPLQPGLTSHRSRIIRRLGRIDPRDFHCGPRTDDHCDW